MTVTGIFQLLSAAALGVFAGSALMEGLVLVPWWRELPAAEFHAWYAANDKRLLDYFRPLTIATAVLAVAAAAASAWTGHAGWKAALTACLLVIAAVVMFPVYFEGANAKFSAGSLSADALQQELRRWQAWHHVRTAIAFAALACSLVAAAS